MELRFNSQQQLIDALESRRGFWQDIDATTLKEHQAREREQLVEFRDKCRAFGKMNLKDLKARAQETSRNYPRLEVAMRGEYCPRSMVSSLDSAINVIRVSGQKSYRISRSGSWSDVHHLLTYDPNTNKDLC